jgi:hypothetical protein
MDMTVFGAKITIKEILQNTAGMAESSLPQRKKRLDPNIMTPSFLGSNPITTIRCTGQTLH